MITMLLFRIGVAAIAPALVPLWVNSADAAPVAKAEIGAVGSGAAGNDSAAATATGEEQYLLRYRFHEGQVLRYESVQTATMQSVIGPNKKDDVSLTRQTRRFRVEDVRDDGAATVSMQFERVHMEVSSNGADPQVFDSSMSGDEVPRTFRTVSRQLKEAAPRFLVETTGVPLNPVSLADEAEHAAAATPARGDSRKGDSKKGEKNETSPQKQNGDSDEAGVDEEQETDTPATAGFAIPLPTDPVKVGDTWKTYNVVRLRIRQGVMRKVNLLQTFRLDSVADGVATISFSTSAIGRLTPVEKGQLIQATPKGTARFHIAEGRLESRELKHDTTVFNAMGQNTMVTSVGRSVERFLPPETPSTAASSPADPGNVSQR